MLYKNENEQFVTISISRNVLYNIMLSEKVKHKIGLFGFIYINFRNKQINLLEIRMEVA